MIGYAKDEPARLREAADFIELVRKLFAEQGGCCAICSKAARLILDRDAETHKPRGLLCYDCKRAIALARDNPERLEKAAEFLLHYRRVPGSTVEQNLWEPIPRNDAPDNIVPLRKDAS